MKGKGLLHKYRLGRNASCKQIVITAEKSETFVIRQYPQGSLRVWCAACAREIECLTVDQVLTLTGLSARNVFRRLEAGEIHFSETEDGQLLFCPNSIAHF